MVFMYFIRAEGALQSIIDKAPEFRPWTSDSRLLLHIPTKEGLQQFIKKSKEKKQTPEQQKQASDAVSLYPSTKRSTGLSGRTRTGTT
jgi:hypothetical protein